MSNTSVKRLCDSTLIYMTVMKFHTDNTNAGMEENRQIGYAV